MACTASEVESGLLRSLAHRFSGYNRMRKWRLFMQTFRPTADTTVLDVGFSDAEYSPSENFIEKHYPHPRRLTALGIDQPVRFRQRYPEVKAVTYPGGRFPFDDQSFDLCWCNAVIEHVGDRQRQIEFLREIRRVARRAFVTTPNRFFPVEVHTRTPLLHFLPKPVFDGYLRRVGKGWATGDYMNLLSLAELRELLRGAGVDSYRIVRNRLGPFALDHAVLLP